jgi:enamine deaminase RidA (YjgF/YER057c/UK114 family)
MTLDDGFVAQFGRACENVAAVVEEAGGAPTDVVSLTIYATDVASYRENLAEVGRAYRAVFGRHFPAMALIGVSELVDPDALVEITGVAVIED